MTTLVYHVKSRTFAADTKITGTCQGKVSKVVRNSKGDICGGAGEAGAIQPMLWVFEHDGEFCKVKGNCAFLVVRKESGAVYEFSKESPQGITWISPYYVMGSGKEYAVGALTMGASAKKAVEIASMYDDSTGSEVEVFKL